MKILAFIELGTWNALQDKDPIDLPLVKRVREFARATGAEVHFSHLVHDSVLQIHGNPDHGDKKIQRIRAQLLADESVWLERLTDSFTNDRITTTASTTFKKVTVKSLVNAIEDHAPDFVFKVSRDHSFVLGLLSNLDWELLRQSPVPVWFVKSTLPTIDRLVTAIDFVDDDDEAKAGAEAMLDHEVLKLGRTVAQALQADLKVVHAYPADSPILLPVAAGAGATSAAMSGTTMQLLSEARQQHELQTKSAHHQAVQNLAEYFGYTSDDVLIAEGNPSVVVTSLAEKVNAGLIVMGATSLSRWERPFATPNAEPTLADANCDVLYLNSTAIS